MVGEIKVGEIVGAVWIVVVGEIVVVGAVWIVVVGEIKDGEIAGEV